MTHRLLVPLIVLLFVLPLTGCFYSREIAQTRRDIERQVPGAAFEREMVVNLGPVSLRTLRWLAGRSSDDDARQARLYLNDLRRVKVGIYRTEHLSPTLDALDLPHFRRFERKGWELALSVREDDEAVWVYYRERHGTVRDLYVVALDDEELVLARVKGHLGRLVTRVMRDEDIEWHALATND